MLDETTRNQYQQQLDTLFARFDLTERLCNVLRGARDVAAQCGGLPGIDEAHLNNVSGEISQALTDLLFFRMNLLNEQYRLMELLWPKDPEAVV